MGRIVELRNKVSEGVATDEEKAELQELEQEAGNVEPDSVDVPDDGEDDEKDLVSLGKKMADIAYHQLKQRMSEDVKKGGIISSDSKKGDESYKSLKGAEKAKAFLLAVLDNDHTKLDHLSGGTSADGGFLVPQEYADTFVMDRRNQTVMRRAGARQISITSNTFNVPQLATRPRVYWTSELAAKSSTSATWTNISLTPYTLASIMTASNQVIADAKIGGNIIDVITSLLTRSIAEEEDKAFFAGSGSGQPSGLNSYSVATISAAGLLNFTVLNNAKYRLGQGYRRNAVWFMNSRVLQVVSGLLDTQNRPIFVDAFNSEFPLLMGKPVFEVDDLESTSIFYGDPTAYWIADREGVSIRVSDEATVGGQSGFERNFTSIRVEERVDGELTDLKAFVEITSVPVS